MKLYVGGVCQGQEELARQENPGAEIFAHFEEKLRGVDDPQAFSLSFCDDHPDAVVVADEIGCGIVPMDPKERAWREAAGRALCVIARQSGQVVRVFCGIGVRIK